MKKILLFAVVALTMLTANAQLMNSEAQKAKTFSTKSEMSFKPQALMKEMHLADAAHPIVRTPKRAANISGYYKRPAGAFVGSSTVIDNAPDGSYYVPFMMMSPYSPYTFVPVIDGMSDVHSFVWGYEKSFVDSLQNWYQDTIFEFGTENLEVQYMDEYDDVPRVCIAEGDDEVFSYQLSGFKVGGTDAQPVIEQVFPGTVLAYPTFAEGWGEEGVDLLVSSKTFCVGGRNGDQRYMMTYYSGAEPWGDNEQGWWFGKNSGAKGTRVDGIAQAFEKPTYPYLLKQVVVETALLVVDAPVEMTCKVYRLTDGIPSYDSDTYVSLPEVPGELIAMGRATVTPETSEAYDGMIFFTLFGNEDGLEYEITPTIDDAILIVLDGYNDEGMESLHDFSAMICSDDQTDEGYGELAYIKYGLTDEEGNFSGEYEWAGLNNFFPTGTMMTGMSIFITIDFPCVEDIPENPQYDFVVDGIYYSIIQSNEVSVTFRDKSYNSYRGDVVIPNEVTNEGINYRVTSIGNNAFWGCNSLKSLTIPVEVTSIAGNAFKSCSLENVCITGNGNWQAGALPSTVKTLYISSGVTSIEGLNVNPTTIYCYSSNPSICDEVTFTGYNGTLHVPAESVARYFIADYWYNFANIIGDAVEPQSITMSQDSLSLSINGQKIINASISPSDATPNTISWQSSNKAIATVENGQVKGISKGECDIVATCVGKQAICHVTIREVLPTSLTLSQNNATMEVGDQISLTATVLPEDATNVFVSWLSTDGAVATVNNGIVTAVAPGECDVIARCGDLSDTCHVTVVERIIYITLDEHEVSVLPNHIISLTPTMTPEATDLKVTSSNPAVAAVRLVNNKVQVVGIKEGKTTISVGSVDGTAVGDTCFVTVYTEVGDVNSDGYVKINDVSALIDYLFSGDESAVNISKADTNNDGKVSIADVSSLINYLLSGEWPWGNREIICIDVEKDDGPNAVTFGKGM